MGLSRKLLENLGIEADKVGTIIEAHAETVEALKEKAEQYKTDAENYKTVQAELEALKTENSTLKAGDDWKAKYDELNATYEAYKTDIANKEIKANKTNAYRELLKSSGISDKAVELILKSVNVDSVELGEDGKIVDSENLSNSFKEEYKDFIQVTNVSGANTQTPPENTAPRVYTRADIANMSRDEINANWAEISKSLSKGE